MIIMYVALGEYIRCVIVLCIMDVVVYMCSALTRAGREEEALHLLEELAENAIHETRSLSLSLSLPTQSLVFTDRCVCCRFEDAGHYYWLLAKSCLNHAKRDHLG